MIYMVECSFDDAAREPLWNDWYSGHLPNLVSVPGIDTAQRFRRVGDGDPRYRALYSVESPDVFTSDGYRARKGGRFPPEWQNSISNWHRNVFDGVDCLTAVMPNEHLLFVEPGGVAPGGLGVKYLPAVALDCSVPQLGLAIVATPIAEAMLRAPQPGISLFVPITPQVRKP